MNSETSILPPQPVAELRAHLQGATYLPADQGYERARSGKVGATPVHDRKPAIIVVPETSDDVVRALAFAHDHGLDFSVRSGGHDVLGASTTQDGLLLDVTRMSQVHVDPATGFAAAGAGARAGMLGARAAEVGRAAVLGMSPNVGVGGLSLGGGAGWLAGTFGATVDTVLSVDLVTADGTILRADHEQNAELFWALRGGGGNFGVATSFTYQLPVLDHPVLAGTIEYKVDIVPFLRFVREFLADCPDRLELTAVIRVEDDGPRGAIRVCWTGDPSTGEEVLRPLREFLPPVLDAIQLQPYGTFSALVGPDENILPRGGEFAELSDDVIHAVAGIFEPRPPQRCLIRIGHLMHGALLQVPFDDTPMIREPGHLFYHVAGYWEDDEDSTDPRAWLDASHEALKPVNASRIYVNYLSNPDQASVRATYGPHYSRLQAVKRQYDPENFFHNNRNIVP